MKTNNPFWDDVIRPIALALVFNSLGFALRPLFTMAGIEMSMLVTSVFNFALAIFGAFFVLPVALKVPFGAVPLSEYLRRLGFYWPKQGLKHVVLGILLAACTLGGMLVASLLTGRYVLDWSTVNISHTVFTLNPGVWEEFFFRGVIVIVLLRYTKSPVKAVLIQILIFGLAHIKDTSFWGLVDVFSVMVVTIAFVYSAYKTRTLVAGIIFHFLHDALLYLVQVPDKGTYIGTTENLLFYGCLWVMVGVACLIIKIASEKFGVQAQKELYTLEES
ncbi:MAG: CPBP family intramembrane metalloprotease [Anaerolineae bacterium]|nr:CPBP family intramembrane metalloprotease [Anaerolineae bacterium]